VRTFNITALADMSYLQTVNPSTEKVISRFDEISPKEILLKLRSLKKNQLQWKDTTLSTRLEYLKKLCRDLEENSYHYAALISLETGLPLKESLREMDAVLELCRWYQDKALATLNPREFYKPQGIFMVIVPRMHTIYLPFRVIIPTLLSGNTVALKHSSRVPQMSQTIEGIFQKSFPKGLVESFLVSRTYVERIIRYPNIKKVYFFGRTSHRKKIINLSRRHHKQVVAPRMIRNSHVILDDSHLLPAVETLISSRMKMSGQSCMSTTHVFVHSDILKPFLQTIETELSSLEVGDPLEETTQLGPVMTRQEYELLEQMSHKIQKDQSRQEVIFGGKVIKRKGWFFHPTVIVAKTEIQPEISGPVIIVHPFSSSDELKAMYGDLTYTTVTQWQNSTYSPLEPLLSAQRTLYNQPLPHFPYFPEFTEDELV
jgi:succinate-semialdehyde dehydrogenase/glutarate-semialdehyde dehydrogenase